MTLHTLHQLAPIQFRRRAKAILKDQTPLLNVRAAAGALRVFLDNADAEDVELIQEYLTYDDSLVKRAALESIAYMGKNATLQENLKRAALSVEVGADEWVACSLADAFGPYGVHISQLTPADATTLLTKFRGIADLDCNQGKVATFVSRLTQQFAVEVTDLLLWRIAKQNDQRRGGIWSYRAFGNVYGHVSYGLADPEVRRQCADRVLQQYFRAAMNDGDEYVELFWQIGIMDSVGLDVITASIYASAEVDRVAKVAKLIHRAPSRLLLAHTTSVTSLLTRVTAANRQKLIEAIVANMHHFSTGGVYCGDFDSMMADHASDVKAGIDRLDILEEEFPDLLAALRKSVN